MDTLTCRPATPGDAVALAALIGDLGYEVTPETAAARLDAVRADGGEALLAFRPGDPAPVGLIGLQRLSMLQADGPLLRITTLVVRADLRSQGLGAALLRLAEAEARRQGATAIELTTNLARTRAQAFYQSNGFEARSLRLHRALDTSWPKPGGQQQGQDSASNGTSS
jgi:ribosomal protein S18 acetylase RimI-like enzyme